MDAAQSVADDILPNCDTRSSDSGTIHSASERIDLTSAVTATGVRVTSVEKRRTDDESKRAWFAWDLQRKTGYNAVQYSGDSTYQFSLFGSNVL